MREQMKAHADRLEFEDAARMRDRVRAIEKTVERQTVLHHWGIDQDVFGLYREGGFIEAIVLMVRGGKLTSTHSWDFQDLEFADQDVLADLLTQYYSGARNIPDEVIVPVALEDAEVRAELLTEKREKKVEFLVPQRGDKLRLLEMAIENARQSFASRRDNEVTREKMLDDLRTKLHLKNTPKRMECYDISNLQGTMVVGSQVTFDEGEPRKDLYRRYRIRSFEGQDDFASMYEVLKRRLTRAVAENEFPDLWVIDGGKGQLNVAIEVLQRVQSARPARCGLARQAARPERWPRGDGGEIRGARVPAQSQGPYRAAEKFHRAVPAGAHPRRGASLRDHLQPRIAQARAVALGHRRYRGYRSGEAARAAAPFRQPAAHPRRDGRGHRAGERDESRPGDENPRAPR